jgi:hypothetical protein
VGKLQPVERPSELKKYFNNREVDITCKIKVSPGNKSALKALISTYIKRRYYL